MKHLFFGISAIFLMFGTQGYAAPFLTETGVFTPNNLVFTYDGDDYSFTVTNRASSSTDVWDAGKGGFTGGDYTGYYLGTFDGNDGDGDKLKALAYYYLGDTFNFSWYKYDVGDDFEPGIAGPLDITKSQDGKTGTWSVEGQNDLYVSFYSVKASNEFAFYLVDPAAAKGDWTTRHLLAGKNSQPGISHLSVLADPGTPIPEPTTMLLFGTGLIGLAGLARRKIS
jgi:hypothetical protein